MIDMFVPPPIRKLFNDVVSGHYDNLDILPCCVGDEESFAIVVVNESEGGYAFTPIFVLASKTMNVRQRSRGGGGGGPKRQFSAAKEEFAGPNGPR
jgi:hypothetical protein